MEFRPQCKFGITKRVYYYSSICRTYPFFFFFFSQLIATPVARLTSRWLLNRRTLLSSLSKRSNGLHFLINPPTVRLSLSFSTFSNIQKKRAGSNLSSSARGRGTLAKEEDKRAREMKKERKSEGWMDGRREERRERPLEFTWSDLKAGIILFSPSSANIFLANHYISSVACLPRFFYIVQCGSSFFSVFFSSSSR